MSAWNLIVLSGKYTGLWSLNGFCKRVLKNEAINTSKQRQSREMTFYDLTPQEENQIYTLDKLYEGGIAQGFQVTGKRVTPNHIQKWQLALSMGFRPY